MWFLLDSVEMSTKSFSRWFAVLPLGIEFTPIYLPGKTAGVESFLNHVV
jgi:hypothetical protein